MKDNLSRQFRRVPLHHGHWCDEKTHEEFGPCHANPCQIGLRRMLADNGMITVAVTQQPDRAVVRLLGEGGEFACLQVKQVDELIECLQDAVTVARGSWPEFWVA